MSLYEKMYQVMTESEGLEKDLIVGTGSSSYKAVGEKEVLNMLKPLFKKYKLVVFPVDGDISEENSVYDTSYKGEVTTKTRNVTQIKVKFKIVDVDSGESELLMGFGNGADSQDKGSGKAFTYAYKTMLSKTFMLFSGEDTDNEHSDDIGRDKRQQSKSESAKQSTNMQQDVNSKCSKVQVAELFKLSAERKIKFPDFDFFKFLDEMAEKHRISTKFTYGDNEKTKINWTVVDYEVIKSELLLPF